MDWVYFNDSFILKDKVSISPYDRGFLFGDSVYEVIPVYEGKAFLLEDHLTRLERSLMETKIKKPISWKDFPKIIEELVKRNSYKDQQIYVQITRGVDEHRNHIPSKNLNPTCFISSAELSINPFRINPNRPGLEVKSVEDTRWSRCDIKAVTLLPNVMALREANYLNKDEVIFLKEDKVNEGAASNVFAVFSGVVMTPPVSSKILSGVTRNHVINTMKHRNISFEEQELTIADLYTADEVWMTSSTKELQPVSKIDDKKLKLTQPEDSIWLKVLNSFFINT